MLRGESGTTRSVGNLIDEVHIGCEQINPEEFVCPDEDNGDDDDMLDTLRNGIIQPGDISTSRVNLQHVPASTTLNIKVTDSGKDLVGKYFITSLTGRRSHIGTLSTNASGESNVITEDVSSLPDGIYMVMMEIGGKQISEKFIKVSEQNLPD